MSAITKPAWATKVETSDHVEDQCFYRPLKATTQLLNTANDTANRSRPGAFKVAFEVHRCAYDSDPVLVRCSKMGADFHDIEDVRRLGEALLAAYAEAVEVLGRGK